MQRTKAPFRADEVGSLLRPQRIKEARLRLEKGEITADDLRKAEDMEIEKVVHRQGNPSRIMCVSATRRARPPGTTTSCKNSLI